MTTMTITSSAFIEGGMIPSQYTCDGANISPPLGWTVPQAAKSVALICDDPDAPAKTWVHWVVYNIPPSVTSFPEKLPAVKSLPNGALQGTNDFPRVGYGGPCPPSGVHRYFFKFYALDTVLKIEAGATKAQLLKAMEGHIIGQGQLIGKYKRK